MDDRAMLAFDCPEALEPSGIDALLAGMRDAGGERFDAAGWHYLETLATRAAAHDGIVRQMLEAKIERAVASFSDRLMRARNAATELLAATCKVHPEAATQLQRLFADSDFKGLRRLCATLEARQQCAALGELVTQLEPASAVALEQTSKPTAVRVAEAVSPPLELKTVRESRATWARMSVYKQLALAMNQAPQNAGPINSHMLVLRSLAMMRDISPDYLSRMVSYVDTLLCLDPGEVEVAVKKKKGTTAKAGKPAKAVKK